MHRTLSAAGAFWLAAFTYFIWGFTFLASRIAQDYGTPFVLLFWRTSPLTEELIFSAGGNANSSAVTMHGPMGVKPSSDLPKYH